MRKFILSVVISVIVSCGACVGGLFVWVAADTAEAAGDADAFLTLIAARKLHEAYMSTSVRFRESQDEESFAKTFDSIAFSDFRIQHWASRTLKHNELVHGETQFIHGEVVERGGRDRQFTARMVQEAGGWKVLSFTDPRRILVGPGAWFRVLPPEQDILALTQEAMEQFAAAVNDNNLRAFYEYTSGAFRAEVAFPQFYEAFKKFILNGVDLSEVTELEPVLDGQAELSRELGGDLFIISGYYPIQPEPVVFKFRFLYRHPKWELYKFLIQEPNLENLTPDHCMKWLVRQGGQDLSRCFQQSRPKGEVETKQERLEREQREAQEQRIRVQEESSEPG